MPVRKHFANNPDQQSYIRPVERNDWRELWIGLPMVAATVWHLAGEVSVPSRQEL